MAELAELQTKLATAMAEGNVKAIEDIAAEITKGKADRHKAEAESQRKEAEQLAGKREAMQTTINAAVKALNLDAEIVKLKAKGFTYTIDHKEDDKGRIDPAGEVKVTGGVGLLVPAVKARTGGGGGSAGKTKDDYGLSLTEVFDKFATDEDQAKLAAAEVKDIEASDKLGKSTNSNVWRVKNDVKKVAIASGALAPSK